MSRVFFGGFMDLASLDVSIVAILVVALFAGVLVALLVWAFFPGRKKISAKQQALRALGFMPLKAPPQDLAARMLAFYHCAPQQSLRLRDVCQKSFTAGSCAYVFGFEDADDDMLAIISPDLNVPRFSLLPRLVENGNVSGFLFGTLSKLVDRAVDQTEMQMVDFVGQSDLGRRFIVFGEDEVELRSFLSAERLAQLVDLVGTYDIEAGRDSFVMKVGSAETEPCVTCDFTVLLEDAERVLQCFL